MPPSELIQNLIHKLEVGTGSRYLRLLVAVLALLALAFLYDVRAYTNFSTPEAMDSAQLARNISEGKGYTTQFIRPFSLYLVQKHNQAKYIANPTTNAVDFADIKTAHPDLANPPVFPVLLAGLMKVLPFNEKIASERHPPFWTNNEKFWRYQPDFLIAVFNEIILLVAVWLTFLIARKLFDPGVAWLAAGLMLGCNLLWRFSVSGLSTMLLLVIFLGIIWLILKYEEAARQPEPDLGRLLRLAVLIGALTGIGALTRYAFGWVIVPIALFLLLFGPQRRMPQVLAVLAAFVALLTPWIIRNYMVSGTLFGTAGYAIVEGTSLFPHNLLERSLNPDFTQLLLLQPYQHKLWENLQNLLVNGLPKLAGSWATILFLAGLMLGFRSLAIRRMRYFLLMCLGMFLVVQALGRTSLSDASPDVNSENLLVLLAPLVLIYSAGVFFTLLDQIQFPLVQLRYFAVAVFVAICCMPMIFALLPPQKIPVVYPPYYPPEIQQTSAWMKENELMMSDVPWAVAWYGNRQCLWLTLDSQDAFFAVNDNLKPIQALYLTPETTDGKFVTDLVRAGELSWGNFILQAVVKGQIPKKFPLHSALNGLLPERLFLTDWERWKLAPLNSSP
jgi:hypothetical protein